MNIYLGPSLIEGLYSFIVYLANFSRIINAIIPSLVKKTLDNAVKSL